MSQITLQRALNLYNLIGQQLPAIAQADEMGVDLKTFAPGLLARVTPPAELDAAAPLLSAIIGIIQPTTA